MVSQTVDAYGGVDILVNNAYFCDGDDILTVDEELWNRNIRGCLSSAFLCCKAVLPHMIGAAQRGDCQHCIRERAARARRGGIQCRQSRVISLTQNIAVRYGEYGVRANSICPGSIQTPAWTAVLEKDPDLFNRLSKWYPLKRVGKPEEIAAAALFLASDQASFVTGTNLIVDGGLTAGLKRMGAELVGEGTEI